jgi:hypothetical protein
MLLFILQGARNDNGVAGCCFVFIALIVAALVSKHYSDKRKAEALKAARDAYLGRQYSALTRQGKNVTIYDEMALMNDINAACAGAGSSPKRQERDSVEDRLARLSDLRSKGLIDEREHEERRRRILDEI